MILMISVSQVARITGINHRLLENIYFKCNFQGATKIIMVV
jgi:hypothetical protein